MSLWYRSIIVDRFLFKWQKKKLLKKWRRSRHSSFENTWTEHKKNCLLHVCVKFIFCPTTTKKKSQKISKRLRGTLMCSRKSLKKKNLILYDLLACSSHHIHIIITIMLYDILKYLNKFIHTTWFSFLRFIDHNWKFILVLR